MTCLVSFLEEKYEHIRQKTLLFENSGKLKYRILTIVFLTSFIEYSISQNYEGPCLVWDKNSDAGDLNQRNLI